MASTTGRKRVGQTRWPKKALALFVLLLVLIYTLVLFTGNRQATPKLGIDLQGGTRVTLVPQGAEPTPDQLAQAKLILQNRVNGMGVSGAEVVTDGNTLVITVPGEDTSQARALGQTSQLLFRPVAEPAFPDPASLIGTAGEMANKWVGLGVVPKEHAQNVLEGLANSINQANQQQDDAAANADTEAADAADGDAAKADEKAGTDAKQADAPEVPKVEVPQVTAEAPEEPENSIEAADRRTEIIEQLKKDRQSDDPTTQFAARALMICDETIDPMAGSDDPAKPFVACDPESHQSYILSEVPLLIGEDAPDGKRLTGNEIDTNRPISGGLNPQTSQMEINFAFKSAGDEQGGPTWAKLTTDYLGKQVAITLDSKIISAPVIRGATPSGNATSITGSFTQEQAQALANNLKYGALPLSFAGENGERGGTATTIPATLGFASLKAGLIAGVVGLLLVTLVCLAYYRVFGFLAVASLFASGALVYGALVLLGRWVGYSLDLAGIAGLIIGIGTTADSFVVFYERIKDEMRDGRTFRSSVPRAWARAKHTILSGNLVSLIAAVVLYVLAVGDVKGFAFTLGLTTIFDLVIIFLVTAPLVLMASRNPWFSSPKVNGLASVMKVAERRRAEGEFLPGDYTEGDEIHGKQPLSAPTGTINTTSTTAGSSHKGHKGQKGHKANETVTTTTTTATKTAPTTTMTATTEDGVDTTVSDRSGSRPYLSPNDGDAQAKER